MLSVREKVFETNSSSCHCLTVLTESEIKDLGYNRHSKCIYLPPAETCIESTGAKYEIIDIDEAFTHYNESHKASNKIYEGHGWTDCLAKIYPDTDEGHEEFEEDLENDLLKSDSGRYLSYDNLLTYVVPQGPMKFDITWWDNQ